MSFGVAPCGKVTNQRRQERLSEQQWWDFEQAQTAATAQGAEV